MTRDRSGTLKWALALAALALMLGGGAWYWMARDGDAPEYQTALVSRGELIQAVTATGQLNPVVNVQVGSQISGMIQKLFVDFNSRVTAGQVIAQLDPATYRAALRQAEGELANASAALELARLKAARAAELRAKDLIPQADDDQTRADLHQAEAAVAIREAVVQKARVDVDRCTIVSPIDGIVISRNVDVGQTVAASLSAPTLFVIANDLTKMEVHTNVDEADVGNISEGQDVSFTVDAHAQRRFRGKVNQVRNAPINVQGVVTYNSVVRIDNKELLLKPGMTANVQFLVAQKEDALAIPNVALRFRPPEEKNEAQVLLRQEQGRVGGRIAQRRTSRGGGSGVGGGEAARVREVKIYVLKDGQAQPVDVQVGITDGSKTEIIAGLNENDPVIIGMSTAATAPAQSGVVNPFQPQVPGGFRGR